MDLITSQEINYRIGVLTIDANGVVTAQAGAAIGNVLVKAETAGKSAVTEPVEVYNMTATTIRVC